MDDRDIPNWYAIRVRSGRELDTARHLRQAGLAEIYDPFREVKILRRGAVLIEPKMIIRGYIFVRTIITPAVINAMAELKAQGITLTILPNNNHPLPIEECKMDAMRSVCDPLTQSTAENGKDNSWIIGKAWCVQSGPFASYVGECTGLTQQGHALLLCSIFGHLRPIPISIDDINPIPVMAMEEVIDAHRKLVHKNRVKQAHKRVNGIPGPGRAVL